MKISVLIISTLVFIITATSGGTALALPIEERLWLEIDIGSHATLELGNDIKVQIDKPWSGGEVREATSNLVLRTNADVELRWESTEIKDEITGQVLPIGISEQQEMKSGQGVFTETFTDQPFGLTTLLVKRDILAQGMNQKSELVSVPNEGETLISEDGYHFEPGVHELDIVLRYYWSADSSWSEILAGRYTGSIIYTVSALDE